MDLAPIHWDYCECAVWTISKASGICAISCSANSNVGISMPNGQFSSSSDPPFRAEHVGSLLRPPALLDARRRHSRQEIDDATLLEAETTAIHAAIELQERVGLRLATDGEFRRASYHGYFYGRLGDISFDVAETGIDGLAPQPVSLIRSRLRWTRPIHVHDFSIVKAQTGLCPKITIPGPCALHFRGGDEAVLARAYEDVDAFWDDVVTAFRSELKSLAVAGCRYVQIDETAFAKFGDPAVQAMLATRGDNWSALINSYIAVTNRVLRDLPEGLTVAMHLCRGNRGGRWHAEGSYDAVAERLFNGLAIRLFLLEYDSPRAGGFGPLRFVPADKTVVLGLVSTKSGLLEAKDDLLRRIDEASRHVDPARLGVSPQCGFASVEAGNPITPDQQEAKLRLVVELAETVWGSA
jgi:5-methyltetrahydropteroyltriglutamate--homocysteine methyltransferase